MKKIAVFCALPPDRNTGMATVDLAAFSVLKSMAPQATITLYTYGRVGHRAYQTGDLPYHYRDVTQHSEEYFASDIFIFWGDFTHTNAYWKIDRGIYEDEAVNLEGDAQKQWIAEQFKKAVPYIFLSELPPERKARSIVFGSTIITNEAQDQLDEHYSQAFTSFFPHVKAVYFRDPLSAAKISPLRNNEATLGCDCALLLQDTDLQQIKNYHKADTRTGLGVFFGRSPAKGRMMIFSRLLAHELGEKCQWIQWFGWGGKPKERWPYMMYGYKIRAADEDTGLILSQLSGCRYIVTDTYHFAVNAWRMGIPAICIGEGVGGINHSLGDKKKEMLFEMYGARRFYVFAEQLIKLRNMRATAKQAATTLQNEKLVSKVTDNLTEHQEMARKRLSAAIQDLLN